MYDLISQSDIHTLMYLYFFSSLSILVIIRMIFKREFISKMSKLKMILVYINKQNLDVLDLQES